MALRVTPLLLALLLLLPACDTAAEVTIGGIYSYSAAVPDGGGSFAVELDLPTVASGEAGFAFTTVATTTNGDGTQTERLEGVGTYDHPTLRLAAEGETLVGTVAEGGDTITITVEGFAVALQRQGLE